MKIYQIAGQPPMYTNTYLVISEGGHAAVIDPAGYFENYQQALEKHHARLTHIFLTHGHYDHVAVTARLKQEYGAAVYMDPADAQGNQLYPLSADVVDHEYREKAAIPLDELEFVPYYTPGHTRGSWCIYCKGYFFTGDTLFCGSIGRTDLPGGNMETMEASLTKLALLPYADETYVLPGHDVTSTLGQERRHNYYLRNLRED